MIVKGVDKNGVSLYCDGKLIYTQHGFYKEMIKGEQILHPIEDSNRKYGWEIQEEKKNWREAQLVEQHSHKVKEGGSNPLMPTMILIYLKSEEKITLPTGEDLYMLVLSKNPVIKSRKKKDIETFINGKTYFMLDDRCVYSKGIEFQKIEEGLDHQFIGLKVDDFLLLDKKPDSKEE